MRLRDAPVVAHVAFLDRVVVGSWTLLRHEFSLVHKLARHCLQCVVSKNLRLPRVLVVGGTFHCFLSLLNVVNDTLALFFWPLILFGVMLCGVIKRHLIIVVGGAWDLALRALGLVNNFGKIGRLWLFIQTVVDLTVNFVSMSARIGYCVLSTVSLKLGFCFTLHHVLNRDTLVWVVFLRLRHSGIVSVQNIVVDGMR